MTDFGKRTGDMKKSEYDTDDDGVADNAETLEGSTKAEVQDHTPKTHTHTESQISDLDHNADKIKGVTVDDTDKAADKVLAYNSVSGNLEYETQSGGGHSYVDRGDPSAWDWEQGDLTTNLAWHDLDCSSIVPAGASAILFGVTLIDNAAGSALWLRKNGNSNAFTAPFAITQVSGLTTSNFFWVPCDSNRVVEYRGSNLAFTIIQIIVLGWLIG